jgi:hypothetical protein
LSSEAKIKESDKKVVVKETKQQKKEKAQEEEVKLPTAEDIIS